MTVSESEITDVTITGDGETLTLGGVAVDTLDEAILEAQTPNVDGVSGATGDGIVMAQAVGADLVGIEQIQLHPTVEQTTSMLITEGVHGGNRIGGNAVADIVVFSRIAGANAIAYCGK